MDENTPEQRRISVFSVLFATALLFATLAGLVALVVLFHKTAFLPHWITITLRVLCFVAAVFSVGFYKSYLSTSK